MEYSYLINCAGLYADKIAKEFGKCENYTILPLRGRYLAAKKKYPDLHTLIYPVPPVKGSYFLGVHLTCTATGDMLKIGPNAFPAMWREQYNTNLLENFNL